MKKEEIQKECCEKCLVPDVDNLEKHINFIQDRLNLIKNKSAIDLWKDDLNHLETVYHHYLQILDQEDNDNDDIDDKNVKDVIVKKKRCKRKINEQK